MLNILAISTNDLHPDGFLHITDSLWIAFIAAFLLFFALIGAIILLAKPRRKKQSSGTHAPTNSRSQWLARVNKVVQESEDNTISDEEAYAQLASITREFAQTQSGRDMRGSTLRDLETRPTSGNAQNWDNLRLTIAALYPPEFANSTVNIAAQEANVPTAAGWVADFIERWR